MIIGWREIQQALNTMSASVNEINTYQTIYNSGAFQLFLLKETGIITDKSFSAYQSSSPSRVVDDLATLDTFELVDYISDNVISFKQAASITPKQMTILPDQLIQKVSDVLVGSGQNEKDSIRFILSSIVQTGFPYKKVKGDQRFERTNGSIRVSMAADNELGLPYGMYPRLFFVYLCSQYKKTKNRRIELDSSLKSLVIDEFGRPWSGGKTGTGEAWRKQIISLLVTGITTVENFSDNDSSRIGVKLNNAFISSSSTLWWDEKYDETLGAHIELSNEIAEALDETAVPIDHSALLKLAEAQSPLAFDFYCWLTYRYWAMEQNKVPKVDITWRSLFAQFATSITSVRKFKANSIEALKIVKSVYPQANFRTDTNCITLLTSEPHVRPQKVVTSTKALPTQKP
jgi:hypothetical protein